MDDQEKEGIDVEIDLDGISTGTDHLVRLGRTIARRLHHQQPVVLGKGVSIQTGGFFDEGGSPHSPVINPIPGTVLVVRNVCAEMANRWIGWEPHIYSEASENQIKISDLQDERAALIKRIDTINNELLSRYQRQERSKKIQESRYEHDQALAVSQFMNETDQDNKNSLEVTDKKINNNWF